MKQINTYRIVIFLILIHAVYFLAACYFKGFYLIDSYGYLMQANNIKSLGTWYAEDWNAPLLADYFSIRPPMYAWLIVGLRFSENVFWVLVVQNILSILNCWLAYTFVSNKVGNSIHIQMAMFACLLFYPAQMMHANFVMTEMLFQSLLLFLFLNVNAFLEQPNWKKSILISVLLSVCLLTKPVSLFLPVIVLGFMIWGITKQKQNWLFLTPLLVTVITFHSICLQNKHATNYYHYSSIKSINQLKYNARYTLINAYNEEYADSVIARHMQQANSFTNYGQRLQYMEAKGNEIIMQNPIAFLQLYTKGVIAFFVDPGRFDAYHFFTIEAQNELGLLHQIQTNGLPAIINYIKQAPVAILFLLAINFCWNILVVCALIYFLTRRIYSSEFRVLIFVFIFYIAAATGPVGVSRYRVPVYPLLIIGVLYAAHSLKGKQLKHA